MSNQVIKVSKEAMKAMQQHYARSLLSKKPPYTEFAAKVNGLTITAYSSGKVMFQGQGAEQEAARWGTNSTTPAKKKAQTGVLPEGFANWSVIGSDEVGNGSYFGPVTVCAAYVNNANIPLLKKLGVRDSKELQDVQIRKLAEVIKETIPYQLLIVPPKKYNEIQPKYNAVHMKVALHNQAIYLLLNKIAPEKPDAILIDQFTPEANYKKYVRNEQHQVKEKLYFITKGEQYHLAVAAASIVSRAAFLEELDKASEELGFKAPSGAGNTADLAAAKVLQKGGRTLLANYAKLHFTNTEKAEKIVARQK